MYTFARKQYCQEFIGANEDSSKQVKSHYSSPVEQLRQSATYINCRTRKQISRLSVFDARTLRFEPCVVTTSLISPLGAIAYLHPSSTSTSSELHNHNTHGGRCSKDILGLAYSIPTLGIVRKACHLLVVCYLCIGASRPGGNTATKEDGWGR